MASVSVPGTNKPITLLAALRRLNEWLRSADSMMARANPLTPKPYRRLQPIQFARISVRLDYLTEESIDT
jgi:hypothetical protein